MLRMTGEEHAFLPAVHICSTKHFHHIPSHTPRASHQTFYYLSHHDQNASYRASLRHGAIRLGSLHFALHPVHGA